MPDGALTADDRAAIVQRHFTVMAEEQAIDRLWFAHALHVGPAVRAALNRIRRRGEPASTVPAPTPTDPVNAEPQDLRGLLGLK